MIELANLSPIILFKGLNSLKNGEVFAVNEEDV